MKKLLKFFALTIGGVIILVTMVAVSFLVRGGAFRTVAAISPGQCHPVELSSGSAEDLQIDRSSGTAYLSVLDRRGIVEGKIVSGTILALSLNTRDSIPGSALSSQPDSFRPHGLSLFNSTDGSQTLVVINHAENGEYLEIFEKQADQQLFDHAETLSTPLLREPNDIVAIGPRKFYIANDSGATNGIERAAEMLLGIGLSPLIYFDGSNFSIVVDDLKSSGGINVSQDLSEIYVGETGGESIRIYGINEDGSLASLQRTIGIQAGVDNVDVDASGDLWIANHTNTLALVKHFGNSDSPAPTQVQKLKLTGEVELQTIYENAGDQFSAGSVGARFDGELLIGSITERKLLRCQIDS
ncbi:MAG: hypothetical protein GKS03_08750 [Alphaproteobacteria bacterium]|nr:hypothetical protein [Alphaproteobacteria bacterium]